MSQKSAKVLDQRLSMEELGAALQTMERGRSPGIDRIPLETSWAVIGDDGLAVLNDRLTRVHC